MNELGGIPRRGEGGREGDYVISGKNGHNTKRSYRGNRGKRRCSRGAGWSHSSRSDSGSYTTDSRVDQVGTSYFNRVCPRNTHPAHQSGGFHQDVSPSKWAYREYPRDPRIPPSQEPAIPHHQIPSSSSSGSHDGYSFVPHDSSAVVSGETTTSLSQLDGFDVPDGNRGSSSFSRGGLTSVTSSLLTRSHSSVQIGIDHQESDKDLKKKIDRLNHEVRTLSGNEELLSKQVDLVRELGKSQKEIDDSYLQFLKTSRQRQKKEIELRCLYYKELKIGLSSVQSEKVDLEIRNDELSSTVSSLEDRLAETEASLERVEKQNTSLSEQINAFQITVRDLLSEIGEFSEQISRLQKENAQVNEEIEEKVSEIRRLTTELDQTKQLLAREQEDRATLSAELQGLASDLEQKSSATEVLKGQKEELKSLIFQNQRTIQGLTDQLQEATKKYRGQTTALTELSQQLQRLISQ